MNLKNQKKFVKGNMKKWKGVWGYQGSAPKRSPLPFLLPLAPPQC